MDCHLTHIKRKVNLNLKKAIMVMEKEIETWKWGIMKLVVWSKLFEAESKCELQFTTNCQKTSCSKPAMMEHEMKNLI